MSQINIFIPHYKKRLKVKIYSICLPHDLLINRNQQPAGDSVNKQLRCASPTRNPDDSCLCFYNHKQQCKRQRSERIIKMNICVFIVYDTVQSCRVVKPASSISQTASFYSYKEVRYICVH